MLQLNNMAEMNGSEKSEINRYYHHLLHNQLYTHHYHHCYNTVLRTNITENKMNKKKRKIKRIQTLVEKKCKLHSKFVCFLDYMPHRCRCYKDKNSRFYQFSLKLLLLLYAVFLTILQMNPSAVERFFNLPPLFLNYVLESFVSATSWCYKGYPLPLS